MKARKHMLWSTRRKLARAAAGLLTASMLMQSMPLMAEEAAFAGEDLFSAETVEEVSVQDAAAAPAEEDAYVPQEAEAAEDAADLFAEVPADADFAADAAEDSFAEEGAAVPEEDLLISEDEQTDDQGGEDLVVEGEEQAEASEEAEEGLTAEEILADDEALFAELFGEEEETEEQPKMAEFFTSQEEEAEAGDPVVVTLPPAGSTNSGKVLMSHAGAGISGSWPGSYGAQLSGLASYIYGELVKFYVAGEKGKLSLNFDQKAASSYSGLTFTAGVVQGVSDTGDVTNNPASCAELDNAKAAIAYGVQSALDAFFYDHPKVFWLHGGSYAWSFGGQKPAGSETADWYVSNISYTPEEVFSGASAYYDEYAQTLASAKTQIMAGSDLNGDGVITNAELLRVIHNYLCETLYYDLASFGEYETTKDYRIFSAGAALVPSWGGGAVCEGYSKAFKVLCDEIIGSDELQVINVKGIADTGEAHMWNGVCLDGAWYLMDVTWDDDKAYSGYVHDYTYFMSGERTDRTKNGNFSGSAAGAAKVFTYPIFSDEDYISCTDAGHEFEVDGKGLSSCIVCGSKLLTDAVVADIPAQTYRGSVIKPAPIVMYDGKSLAQKNNYTVSYTNNIEAGVAQVTLTGTGSYYGEITAEFTILPRDVNTRGFEFDLPEELIWTGEELTPLAGVVSDNGIRLAEETDYTVSYENNTDCGDASVTVEGVGNYTGTKTLTFTIIKGYMEDMAFDEIEDAAYTGSAIEPTVTVSDAEGNALTAGMDYTVAYSSNTKPGTAKVTVTGIGDYRGSRNLTYRIIRDIAELTVSQPAPQTYTGSALKPAVKVTTEDGTELVSGTDYTVIYKDNINVGTATATVTGKGYYTGTMEVEFQVGARSVSGMTIAAIANKTYTGSAHKPAPKVTWGSKTLVSGTDYTVAYKNNTNAGTATVTVTGKGNYKGTLSATFKIAAKKITPAVTLSANAFTFNGKVRKPTVTVKDGTKTLTTADYTVTYASGRKNVGVYKVTVKLKGNYSGTKTVTFKINPKGTTVKTLTAASKAITVKWTKQATKMASSVITGYQIQLATNSTFTANKKLVTVAGFKKVSRKVTGLKGAKKYYVRIRTYKTISGTKYYSPWSKAKTVKTLK